MIALSDDAELFYDDVGIGQPVLFLHAFPLDHTMWAPQTSALAVHCRCLTMDARGMGASSGGGPFSVDRYADDVIAVLDAARVKRAVIVGLSMGGYVAFALWRRYRARVRALVFADSRAGADSDDMRARRRALITLARAQGSEAVAETQAPGLVGKTTRAKQPEILEVVRRAMSLQPVEGVVGALEALMSRPDSTPTLATIDVPTMVIVGDEDSVTTPKESRAMHRAIRASRMEVIAQAGHLSNLERPAAFNAVLVEFLASLETC